MTDCAFCEEQRSGAAPVGGFIYRDDLVYATHTTDGEPPWYLGELMVRTRRHAPTMADLTNAEAQAFGLLITRLSRALAATEGAGKQYLELFAEVTPHVHLFVTARYPGLPEAYWRWKVTEWPEAPRGGPSEVAALCDRLRAHLASHT